MPPNNHSICYLRQDISIMLIDITLEESCICQPACMEDDRARLVLFTTIIVGPGTLQSDPKTAVAG